MAWSGLYPYPMPMIPHSNVRMFRRIASHKSLKSKSCSSFRNVWRDLKNVTPTCFAAPSGSISDSVSSSTCSLENEAVEQLPWISWGNKRWSTPHLTPFHPFAPPRWGKLIVGNRVWKIVLSNVVSFSSSEIIGSLIHCSVDSLCCSPNPYPNSEPPNCRSRLNYCRRRYDQCPCTDQAFFKVAHVWNGRDLYRARNIWSLIFVPSTK